MHLQQSSLYQQYIRALKWNVTKIDCVALFYKKFPFIGSIAKIQRPMKLPSVSKLITFLNEIGIKKISVEAEYTMDQKKFSSWCKRLSRRVKLNPSPFVPTKTILIDLTAPEETIFRRFSEAKRRAVRRAQKNNLQIYQSANIRELMNIKNKSAGLFGFIVTWGIDKLWTIFAPKHAAILLAKHENNAIGGVLLLFWKKIAYYWIAGATKEGKKLFAPTLLVWEALKLSKQRGCTKFDFVGVWDERLPHYGGTWKGFTKFKEGFGGEEIYYPIFSKRLTPEILLKSRSNERIASR